MLNETVGRIEEREGVRRLRTARGRQGHAVWGDYHSLPAGRYIVRFDVRPTDIDELNPDAVYALADVVTDAGGTRIAERAVTGDALAQGAPIAIAFRLDEPTVVEARVQAFGNTSLLIADVSRPSPLSEGDPGFEGPGDESGFPDRARKDLPAAFTENLTRLEALYERGVKVDIVDGEVVITVRGVRLRVREEDDLRFVGEIFFDNQYNVLAPGDVCMIDVGMNIGLATLFFARSDAVKEVHAFEPFAETFDRAQANIGLNPALAEKITIHPFGLSDRRERLKVHLSHNDSGAYSVTGAGSGRSVEIEIRDASEALGPIIDQALARGRRVVAKVDCEGSEFEVFRSLSQAGLMKKLSALMVEWHGGNVNKAKRELFEPLLRDNFIVFDITNAVEFGNGFFYAVRTEASDGR